MAEEADRGRLMPEAGGATLAAALGALSGSAKVEQLVERQIALADLQIEDIKRDDKLRRWSLRFSNASAVMKVAFELALALIVLVIAGIAAGAVWSAHEARGLVIESFEVPPSLAERGLTGQVVASRLLDKLSGLQDKTDSLRAPNSYANNWGDDIKVQIPDTGVSVGEFNRYLRQWLGHETHITGEIWREGDGIAVVARAGADQGTVFTGKDGELDALLQKAAESVYEKTQPYRYAAYLVENGNKAKAEQVLQTIIATAPPSEQAWALSLLSNKSYVNGDFAGSVALNARAIALDPDNALAFENRAEAERELSWDEDALRDFRRTYEMAGSGRSDINPAKLSVALRFAQLQTAQRLGDLATSLTLDAQIETMPDYAGSAVTSRLVEMLYRGWLHDRAGLGRLARAPIPVDIVAVEARQSFLTQAQFLVGDTAGATKSYFALLALPLPPQMRGFASQSNRRQPLALYAWALAQQGDFKGADAAIAGTPADCDTCLRMRGTIAALEKQWGRADYWFARAAAHAPSVPFADSDWGMALLAKGDPVGAIAKFDSAHRKGPHFADPLEMWGEALMAKNRADLALPKFAEANQYAPNWGRLHLKWGEALAWSGDKAGVAKQFAVAAGLDLSAADRAELARVNHG
jgi:tetratricopeptide (TPR) repeat protein